MDLSILKILETTPTEVAKLKKKLLRSKWESSFLSS